MGVYRGMLWLIVLFVVAVALWAADGVLEGVERPVDEPEGQQAANYGVEAQKGGNEVEAPAEEKQVGQHPDHGDEGGEQVGRHSPHRVRKVGEDQDRGDRAQQDVEGEFEGAVDEVQLTPLWGRSASPKEMIYHDHRSELPRTP